MTVRPKCPKCEAELDLKQDIRWENFGFLRGAAIYYCGKCGAILSVGKQQNFSRRGE